MIYKPLFLIFSQGYITLVLNCSLEMHNISYAWRGLKEQLGEGIDDQIKRMTFLRSKKVFVSFTRRTALITGYIGMNAMHLSFFLRVFALTSQPTR